MVRGSLAALMACLCLGVAPGAAQTAFSEGFGAALEETGLAGAAEFAAGAVTSDADQEAVLALGVAQFLLAVEGLADGLYRFGLGNAEGRSGLTLAAVMDLPFLRVPVPPNPDPEQVSYEGLRAVLEQFGKDLALADETLARVGPEPVDLRLDLGKIGFLLGKETESLAGMDLEEVLFLYRIRLPAELPPIDLDQSDAPWIRGYTHLLRAMTEFLLAHDWKAQVDSVMHATFPDSELPSSPLREARERALAFVIAHPEPPNYYRVVPYGERQSWSIERWTLETPEGRAWKEWDDAYGDDHARAEDGVWMGNIADLIAFIHLWDWPVIAPERREAARQHMLQMIALSRENWRRILAETDDKVEWVPSPTQRGGIVNMRVTPAIVAGWHGVLDTGEDLLEGRKLMPHFRFFDRGVNLRRLMQSGQSFDPVMMVQGVDVIPFLEEGEIVSGQDADALINVFGRGFLAYFIWFN